MLIREKYNSTEPKTDVNLLLNGFTQFKIKEHKLGFRSELGNLRLAILAIIDLLVKVSLSFELRFHFGAGYRIYFGEVDNTIVLLLCGGDKSSQARDIDRAKAYWMEHKGAL